MTAPVVSVVVVSHDSGPTLSDCIDRVLRQDLDCELLLIDNATVDGSLAALPDDPRLRVTRNVDNRGFGAACNQGAEQARGDWLLFLNPDCLLPTGALRRLHGAIVSDPSIGLLGALLANADGTPQAAARRAEPRLDGLLRRRSGHLGHAADPCIERVEATSGALMLMPRGLFTTLGGFDEGYRLHCEDLDLCRRVRASGRDVAIVADLHVTHLKGLSSQRRPIWVEWQKHRGMLRYLRKFECRGLAMLLYPLLWVAVWLRFVPAAARAWWSARRARRRLRQ